MEAFLVTNGRLLSESDSGSSSPFTAPPVAILLGWESTPKLPQEVVTFTESFLAHLRALTLVLWILTGGVCESLKPEVSGEGPQNEKGLVAQLVREFKHMLTRLGTRGTGCRTHCCLLWLGRTQRDSRLAAGSWKGS